MMQVKQPRLTKSGAIDGRSCYTRKYIHKNKERDAEIVTMRREGATYEVIGQHYGGITRERVRQIIKKNDPEFIGKAVNDRLRATLPRCQECGITLPSYTLQRGSSYCVICGKKHKRYYAAKRYLALATDRYLKLTELREQNITLARCADLVFPNHTWPYAPAVIKRMIEYYQERLQLVADYEAANGKHEIT